MIQFCEYCLIFIEMYKYKHIDISHYFNLNKCRLTKNENHLEWKHKHLKKIIFSKSKLLYWSKI